MNLVVSLENEVVANKLLKTGSFIEFHRHLIKVAVFISIIKI